MKKTLLGILLASISVTTFAMDIKNGKLLSHREWTSSNEVVASIKDLPVKPTPFTFGKRTLQEEMVGKTVLDRGWDDHVYYVGENIELEGEYFIGVWNNTDKPQAYVLRSRLCTKYKNDCINTEDRFTLDIGGMMEVLRQPTMTLTYKHEILDEAYLIAFITNETSKKVERVFSSVDFHEVIVSDKPEVK